MDMCAYFQSNQLFYVFFCGLQPNSDDPTPPATSTPIRPQRANPEDASFANLEDTDFESDIDTVCSGIDAMNISQHPITDDFETQNSNIEVGSLFTYTPLAHRHRPLAATVRMEGMAIASPKICTQSENVTSISP